MAPLTAYICIQSSATGRCLHKLATGPRFQHTDGKITGKNWRVGLFWDRWTRDVEHCISTGDELSTGAKATTLSDGEGHFDDSTNSPLITATTKSFSPASCPLEGRPNPLSRVCVCETKYIVQLHATRMDCGIRCHFSARPLSCARPASFGKALRPKWATLSSTPQNTPK